MTQFDQTDLALDAFQMRSLQRHVQQAVWPKLLLLKLSLDAELGGIHGEVRTRAKSSWQPLLRALSKQRTALLELTQAAVNTAVEHRPQLPQRSPESGVACFNRRDRALERWENEITNIGESDGSPSVPEEKYVAIWLDGAEQCAGPWIEVRLAFERRPRRFASVTYESLLAAGLCPATLAMRISAVALPTSSKLHLLPLRECPSGKSAHPS